VVSRQLTRHHVFNLPEALPEAQRRAALDLQVRKSFPFKQPGFAVQWQGQAASVYAWDSETLRAAQDEAGVPHGTQVVPETFMRPRHDNGARLAAMLDGVEGQIWADGFLRATRWWPEPPAADDWRKFLRASGLQATDSEPVPAELAFTERPWTEGAFSLDDWSWLMKSPRALAAAATAALCPFVLIGAQITAVSITEARIQGEIQSLSAANQDVRKDRAAAYANLDAVEDILDLDPYPAQAEVLSTAITHLANAGAPKILSWNFDRGNLEVILRGAQDLDPTAYITLFERDTGFEGVSGTFVGQERDLQLRMTLSKKSLE
jgi:hypothetical protein